MSSSNFDFFTPTGSSSAPSQPSYDFFTPTGTPSEAAKPRSTGARVGRGAMQAVIGGAKGVAIRKNPMAALYSFVADMAAKGATENEIRENLQSDVEMQAMLDQVEKMRGEKLADRPPALSEPEVRKGSQQMEQILTGGEGATMGALTAPLRALGVETAPQDIIEQRIRQGTQAAGMFGKDVKSTIGAGVTAPLVTEAVERGKKSENGPKWMPEWLSEMIGDLSAFALSGGKPSSLAGTASKEANIPTGGEPPSSYPGKFSSEYEMGKAIRGAHMPPTAAEVSETVGRKMPTIPTEGPSLINRATAGGRNLPVQLPSEVRGIAEDVGKVFSRQSFRNTTDAGHGTGRTIQNNSDSLYQQVTDSYGLSQEMNREIVGTYPEYVAQLEARIEEFSQIPHPSGPTSKMINASRDLLNKLRTIERTESGDVVHYNHIPNQVLISQVQEFNSILDHDFPHGKKVNIFRGLAEETDSAAYRATENHPAARESLLNARATRASWGEIFDNDAVRPFRDLSNIELKKTYEKSLNTDDFPLINRALNRSPQGRQVANIYRGDVAVKELSPQLENLKNLNPREFEAALRELEPIASPEQINEIREAIKPHIRMRGKTSVPEKPTKAPKAEDVFEGKTNEQLASMANTQSGLDQLEKTIGKTPAGRAVLEDVKQTKAVDLLLNGKLTPGESAKTFEQVFNDKESLAMLRRLLGDEKTGKLRKVMNNLGDIESKLSSQEKALSKIESRKPQFNKIKHFTSIVRNAKLIKSKVSERMAKVKAEQLSELLETETINYLSDLASP